MKKILIIDDEEWLREMVHMALQQRGFDVLEAENGATGIEVAQRELPDLILCDVNMAKVDGYLTLSSLRNQVATASIPLILMTGLPDPAGMRHGMELGADDYLPKPFTIEGLYAAVDARLKKAQTVRQEAERKLADLRDNISLMLPHELRTPLNGILAYADLLATDSSLSAAEVAEMGREIHQSGERLRRLIENFLIYAQIEMLAADPQKIQAARQKMTRQAETLIEQNARARAVEAQRSGDLVLHLSPNLTLPISEDYLGRIVDELVHNALKFSEAGSSVTVATSESPAAVTLSVTDSGRGFSTDHIRRIGAYMQFERKMHEQQGQGLGLTIAKRLAELHGGTLTIQSERGNRTVVTVKLPR